MDPLIWYLALIAGTMTFLAYIAFIQIAVWLDGRNRR